MTAIHTNSSARRAAKATRSVQQNRSRILDSVRVQLTLWHVGLLSLVLVSFSVTVYILVARDLYARLDAGLRSTLETVAAAVQRVGATREISNGAVLQALEQLYFPYQAIAILDAE